MSPMLFTIFPGHNFKAGKVLAALNYILLKTLELKKAIASTTVIPKPTSLPTASGFHHLS